MTAFATKKDKLFDTKPTAKATSNGNGSANGFVKAGLKRGASHCQRMALRNKKWYVIKGAKYAIDQSSNDFYLCTNRSDSDVIKDVVYMHELQNLYFAMTGVELTLKEFAHG